MAYTLKGYSKFPYNLILGNISNLNSTGTTVKCALMQDTYTPNQNTDEFFSDIESYEITTATSLNPSGDYISGGALCSIPVGGSVSVSGTVTTVNFEDPEWANSTIGAYSCVFYDATPTATSAQCLIAYCEFGSLKESNSGTYKIVINSSGLFTLTVP